MKKIQAKEYFCETMVFHILQSWHTKKEVYFKDTKLMEWCPAYLGINPMENLYSIFKWDAYENGK